MKWTTDLAYSIGLITTDGSLSIDGRHINLTSKDIAQIETFAKLLKLGNKIGVKHSSYNPSGVYYYIQFGNVDLYRFLLSIGLTTNKSKTLGIIKIPKKYFADFLRGHLDGDGYTYSYWDRRWKSSFMLYTVFVSASHQHIEWLRKMIESRYSLGGKVKNNNGTYHLIYAKRHSLILLNKIYYKDDLPCLKRKWFKIKEALGIIR